ncbi:MAG: hypothetical protein PQJ47_09375 [Sphaerochaetaceae bacterium]|nr:hypothetical protein [Sphaerochaetaceae bacterium]
MKVMKLLAVLIIPFMFTGCLDFFHSISIHDGEVDMAVRYTIQSALIDMLGEYSGEKIDIDDLLGEADSTIPEYEGFSFEAEPVDTSFHKGVEIHVNGSLDNITDDNSEKYFLPLKDGDHYRILIPSLADIEELDEMAAVFLSGSKYTMLVDLTGDLEGVKKVRLIMGNEVLGPDEKDSEILINTYGSSMLIEIPVLFLFYAPEDFYIELS